MLYTWKNPDSLLHEAEIFSVRESAPEALIHTPVGASPARLQAVAKVLEEHHFLTTPDVVDHNIVLRVQKFGDRDNLFRVLSEIGAVKGEVSAHANGRDPKPKSYTEWLGENSMTISGILYLLGDALLTLAGVAHGDKDEIAGGVIWGSTGVVLSTFGKKNTDRQMGILYRGLGEYLDKEGVPIPNSEREVFHRLSSGNSLYDRGVEFLYKYPVEFNNTLQTIGGLKVAKAGKNQENPWKQAAGYLCAAGQTAGMLIPERHRLNGVAADGARLVANGVQFGGGDDDRIVMIPVATGYGVDLVPMRVKKPKEESGLDGLPEEPDRRGWFQKTIDWVQEKPLRVTGIGAGLNNLCILWGAYKVEKPKVAAWMAEYPNNVVTLHREIGTLKHEIAGLAPSADQWNDKNATEPYFTKAAKIAAKERHVADIERVNLKQLPWGLKPYHPNVAAAGCYLLANTMYGLSSKDTARDLMALGGIDEVCGVLANIIHARPREEWIGLANRIAGHLSEQPDVKQNALTLANIIREKLEGLEQSPWVERVTRPTEAYVASGAAPI